MYSSKQQIIKLSFREKKCYVHKLNIYQYMNFPM